MPIRAGRRTRPSWSLDPRACAWRDLNPQSPPPQDGDSASWPTGTWSLGPDLNGLLRVTTPLLCQVSYEGAALPGFEPGTLAVKLGYLDSNQDWQVQGLPGCLLPHTPWSARGGIRTRSMQVFGTSWSAVAYPRVRREDSDTPPPGLRDRCSAFELTALGGRLLPASTQTFVPFDVDGHSHRRPRTWQSPVGPQTKVASPESCP